MIASPNNSMNPINDHLATRKQRMSAQVPVQSMCLKIDKLKNMWARRVKPIIASGSHSASALKPQRRRTVMVDMIGFPQHFIHSKHVGIYDGMQMEPNSNDVPLVSLFGSEDWPSLCRLPESEAEAALDTTHQDHTMPFAIAKLKPRHSVCSPLAPAVVTAKKVKRKSVPINLLQEFIDSSPLQVNPPSNPETSRRRFSRVSIEESLLQLINYEQPQILQDDRVKRSTLGAEGPISQS